MSRCPVTVSAGVRVLGPGTMPVACVPCGLSRSAGVGEVAPGGVRLTVVRGVWCQALSLSRLPVLESGSRAPWRVFVGRGWCGRWDLAPAPQHVRSCEPALRAVGEAGGRPQGVPHAVVRGFCG